MEFENHKMIALPEKRRYLSALYERSQGAPSSEGDDSIQMDHIEPGPEVPPKPNVEVTPEPNFEVTPEQNVHADHADHESEAGNDIDKYPLPATKSRSVWKRTMFGRSIRFWSLIAIGILLAVIVGTAVGITLRRKHDRNNDSDFTTYIPPTPTNITLQCPSINEQIYNTTSSLNVEDPSETRVPFQFKQFCNKAAIVASSNMTQITTTDEVDSTTGTFIENPTTATSINDCIQQCVSYNTNDVQLGSGTAVPCFGAWFNANQTTNGQTSNYNNCYLYSMAKGNFTIADVLVESGGKTAMAVMVSWQNSSFVGSYLSNNGDWSGGVTETGTIIL